MKEYFLIIDDPIQSELSEEQKKAILSFYHKRHFNNNVPIVYIRSKLYFKDILNK